MNTENKKYTPEQEMAINYRGGSLLVSSAAGSGKTMVLVERLLSHIDEGRNIDEFLVITYTRAAAAELRERIYAQLQQRLAANPGNRHIRRQTMLCKGAYIDTIHTFCSILLRENAHLAGLTPDFRIADESECKIIKSEVLDDVFSRTYEENKDNIKLNILLEMLVDGRNDTKLMQIVKDIHEKLMSTPDPEQWIEEQKSKIIPDETDDISKTEFGRYIIEVLSGRLKRIYEKMQKLQGCMEDEPEFKRCYGVCVDELTAGIKQLQDGLMNGWDEARKHTEIAKTRPKPISGFDELKEIRNWCDKEYKKIAAYLDASSSEHIKDTKQVLPAQEMLLTLVSDFDKAYTEEKRKRGIVDFSDLEHLTLTLLYDKALGKKTQIAAAISKRFAEILVDEYQDVNEVQEMLFRMLSDNERNIFMVGDVKQSIYRFRLAEPTIFLEKYNNYETFYGDYRSQGVKINLSMNFRSRAGILETANHIFKSIMSEQFGEIEYTDDVALIPGRKENGGGKQGKKGKQGHTAAVEFDVLSADMGSTEPLDEENPKIIELEAEYIAERIKKLLDLPYMTEDKNGDLRPLRKSDIAILSRSVKGKSWRYAEALRKRKIASDISDSEEFFETLEIQAVLSLLSVIDNPMQDIPLAAALGGPVFDFTSSALAQIRASDKDANFYEALIRSQEPDKMSQSTACKCKKTLLEISELRKHSKALPSDRFIWHVYKKTNLLEKVSSMKGGDVRRDNLIALTQIAQDFESSGYKGLFAFLTFIQGLQERGSDIGAKSAGTGNSSNDAVKILSIHKSKGLEFPVVFLVDTAKSHNTMDLNKPVVFHKKFGIGCQMMDAQKRIRYTTLEREAIKEKLKYELLSEELRVLYVAMTRAEEKLIITAAYNDAEKTVNKVKMLAGDDGSYTPQALMSMNSMAQWLMAGMVNLSPEYGVINMVDLELEKREVTDASAEIDVPDESTHKTVVPELQQISTQTQQQIRTLTEKPAVAPAKFEYPYEEATHLPSKLTVTALKSITDPEAESAPWLRREKTSGSTNIRKPRFADGIEKLSGAERGTLIHSIMRYIDYEICSDENDIWEQLETLCKNGILEEVKVKQLKKEYINKIAKLLKSDLGKRMTVSRTLKREFKFSLSTPAEKYFKNGGDDEILLQGIIDCYFEENGEIVIVDYKTDKVNTANINETVEKYTPQLQGYSEALERISGKRVKERYIYFFESDTAVSV